MQLILGNIMKKGTNHFFLFSLGVKYFARGFDF